MSPKQVVNDGNPAHGVADALRYFDPAPLRHEGVAAHAAWALRLPFASWLGGRAVANIAQGPCPAAWADDLRGKRVLIVGSGPSLDRVDQGFLDSFDALLYINFALRRRRRVRPEYFFTTDIWASKPYFEQFGAADFLALGPDRAIVAPIYLDHWHLLTPEGRALFTWLGPDHARFETHKAGSAKTKLPLLIRYSPRQPDWERYALPEPGRTLPILTHTSALSAILFAAINRASDIGLIGCDFSAGRAASLADSQGGIDAKVFAGAPAEFARIKAMLERYGIALINHSWLV